MSLMNLPEAWYVVASSRELRSKPLRLKRFGRWLALWRSEEGVHLVDDRCPHRGASLAAGKVRNGCLECPFHGFLFAGDGSCTAIPANAPGAKIPKAMRVDTWRVVERHGFIWAWVGEARETYPEIPFFHQLEAEGYHMSELTEDWDAHWTRTVENQLDFAHLPFVHKSTIGMGIDPGAPIHVHTECSDDGIQVWMSTDQSFEGRPDEPPFLEMLMPILWRNRIGARTYGFLAYVPVDEETTRLYLRWYQKLVTVPVIAGVFAALSNLLNRKVLAQDRRVVESQLPKASALRGGNEILVPSDRPIVEFRRWLERSQPSFDDGKVRRLQA